MDEESAIYQGIDTVLLIENNSIVAEMALIALYGEVGHQSGALFNKGKGKAEWVRTLTEATDLLSCKNIDVILPNLVLPKCAGIDALALILKVAPETIVVMSCTTDQVVISPSCRTKRRSRLRAATSTGWSSLANEY